MRKTFLLAAALAGCTSAQALDGLPLYLGQEARKIDAELVNIFLWMRASADPAQLDEYANCAVAQYTLDQSAGFARHLRTNITKRGGIWRLDAIYTISVDLPPGQTTIDAKAVAQSCVQRGIPTR